MQWTWIVYFIQVVTFLTGGLFGIIGLIINLMKWDEARRDPITNTHFRWQMRTFCWSFFWNVIGFCTLWIGIGYLILLITFLWSIYRLICGMLKLSKNHPM